MSVAVFLPPKVETTEACALVAGKHLAKSGRKDGRQQRSLLGMRILLVEDDYLLAFDLLGELLDSGAEVIGPVGELDPAFKLAQSAPRIDAALIDINLHGEFAFHLVDELIRRDIQVAFSTGYDEEVVPYRLRHIPLFSKPAPASDIVQGLALLIAGQRSRGL